MNVYKQDIVGEEEPQSKYMAMDFPIPMNIAGMAEAMGVAGQSITDPADLAPALKAALESGKPAVLDVSIDGSV